MSTKMNFQESEASKIAFSTFENGWSRINASFYLVDEDEQDLKQLQKIFFDLPPDENGGRRFRAYKKLLYLNNELTSFENSSYQQSSEYNDDLGGVVRNIAPMDEGAYANPVLQKAILADLEIARNMGIIDFEKGVLTGLHPVRYNPTKQDPSFSSPAGLHRDDEDIVFIHFINASANLIGGENIICESPTPRSKNGSPPFIAHLNLTEPMETLCVTKKHYHQVFPMSVGVGNSAYRDILLVTFEQM